MRRLAARRRTRCTTTSASGRSASADSPDSRTAEPSIVGLVRRRTTRGCGRTAIVFAVACTLALGAGCSRKEEKKAKEADPERVTSVLNDALQAHVEGRTSDAVSGYQQVLQLDPTNKFAIYNLGLISQNAGNNADAETKYRQVLQIDPNYEPALFNLAIIRTAAGDNNEALSLYRRAIAADPNDASAHLNLGLLLRRTGNRPEGDAEVRKALELNPKLTDPGSR